MDRVYRQMNLKPWEQAIAYFWYNDDEIFRFTQEDFDNRAKDFADRGVTLVETFSFTHFRLGFYPYWKEINECIRKIVIACHKYGIRVVEHHSSHLTHYLRTMGGWKRFGESMQSYANGSGSYDNWYKTLRFLTADFMIEGKDLRTFLQIDGRTGEPAENVYGAYSMCFNNPDYREVYFNYLKDVVATGIDGIMNDDVQFFGDRNACTCRHCRKLFTEQTGYTLPEPGAWGAFFENYDDPVYVAWKKFKFGSTERFYRDLTRYYAELGVELIRPNYSSDILKHCPTCSAFGSCADLWHILEQENCFSAVIKESYMDFYTESIHRYAAGRRRGVPSVSMFYPDRPDSTYFAWALARSWGQLYSGTSEGFDITELEKPYRDFEQKFIRYYTAPDKMGDLSFYLSLKTRDYMADAFPRYTRKFMAGMQAAYVSGLCVDMVMEKDPLEELLRHKRIVASHVAMASDAELLRFSDYVKAGGTLVILGEFAVRDEDGRDRDASEVERLLGITPEADTPVCLGAGRIYRMSFRNPEDEFQPTVWVGRKGRSGMSDMTVPSKWELQKNGTGEILRRIVGVPNVQLTGNNKRIVAAAYGVENALAVHIVNLDETVSADVGYVSHEDLIPNFTVTAPKLTEITAQIRLPDGVSVKKAVVRTPETENETEVAFGVRNGFAEVVIPGGIFSGYALLTLDFECR